MWTPLEVLRLLWTEQCGREEKVWKQVGIVLSEMKSCGQRGLGWLYTVCFLFQAGSVGMIGLSGKVGYDAGESCGVADG